MTVKTYRLLRAKLEVIKGRADGYNIGSKTMGLKTSYFEKILEDASQAIKGLSEENKVLKHEPQAVKNTHIKIQYHNEELIIKEICERLERAEKAKHSLIAFLSGLCMACVERYDCNNRKGSHKRCWRFDCSLIGED